MNMQFILQLSYIEHCIICKPDSSTSLPFKKIQELSFFLHNVSNNEQLRINLHSVAYDN